MSWLTRLFQPCPVCELYKTRAEDYRILLESEREDRRKVEDAFRETVARSVAVHRPEEASDIRMLNPTDPDEQRRKAMVADIEEKAWQAATNSDFYTIVQQCAQTEGPIWLGVLQRANGIREQLRMQQEQDDGEIPS